MKTNEIKQLIADKVAEQMTAKNRLPWDSGLLNKIAPINYKTRREYQGINVMLLANLGESKTGEYMTFCQAKEAGGKVKKGSKGCPIVFYTQYNKTEKRAAQADDDREDLIPVLKRYTVFAVDQIDGVEPKREIKTSDAAPIADIETEIKRFFEKTNLLYAEKAGTACYNAARHAVIISPINYYKRASRYYAALLHEMAHSTQKALNRKTDHKFGSEKYSAEEVCAEFAAAMLCVRFGLDNETDNKATYIADWASAIKKDPDILIKGANQGQKAYEYILNIMGVDAEKPELATIAAPPALPAPEEYEIALF